MFGFLRFALLTYVIWLLREIRNVIAQANDDREEFKAQCNLGRTEFKAQLDRQRDESNVRANRERDESKAQSREDPALYVRDHAQLSNAVADVSNTVGEQSKSIATLQGDVQVLLDRSDRPADGKVGKDRPATRYEIARQAVPAPREEEDGEDEQR